MPEPRRFPPPRAAEEPVQSWVASASSWQALACVYFEEEPGRRAASATLLTRDEARRFAANIAKPLKRPQLDTGFSLRSS